MTKGDVIAICILVLIAVLLGAGVTYTVIRSELCTEKGGVFISGHCFNKEALK